MTQNPQDIDNISLVSPNRFKVIIPKFPGVEYFVQKAPIPAITMGNTKLYTNKGTDYWTPGDKIVFDELILTFLLDEDLVGFTQLKDWLVKGVNEELKTERYSDIRVHVLTNNHNMNKVVVYKNCFPYSLTSPDLDVARAEDDVITIQVGIKYSDYDILDN